MNWKPADIAIVRAVSGGGGGGGEGGTSDHRLLTGWEAENQHPISSIVSLEERLDTIPKAMSADELRKILMS